MGYPHKKRPWWDRHLCTIIHGFHLWTRHSFLASDSVAITSITEGEMEFLLSVGLAYSWIVLCLGLWPSL